MDLQHTFTVPTDIEAAWEAFTDIERIAPCLPGAAITSVDGDEFTGTARVKLGPISLQYTGKGEWVSRNHDLYSAVIEAQGKDKRGNGTAGATISAHLEPDGTSTRVVVDTELKVTGRPAQFGRGVIEDVGGTLLDQFAECLAARLVEPVVVAESPDGGTAGSASGTGTSADPTAAQQPDPVLSSGRPVTAGDGLTGTGSPEPAEIDLGGVLGPVLLKRLAPVAVGLVVLVLLIRHLRRR